MVAALIMRAAIRPQPRPVKRMPGIGCSHKAWVVRICQCRRGGTSRRKPLVSGDFVLARHPPRAENCSRELAFEPSSGEFALSISLPSLRLLGGAPSTNTITGKGGLRYRFGAEQPQTDHPSPSVGRGEPHCLSSAALEDRIPRRRYAAVAAAVLLDM